MAANRTARVIFIDAPGTYNAVMDVNEFANIASVTVLGGTTTNNALLVLYAAGTAVAARTIFTGTGIAQGTSMDYAHHYNLSNTEDTPPDSYGGLTAVLTGTGAQALIYLR